MATAKWVQRSTRMTKEYCPWMEFTILVNFFQQTSISPSGKKCRVGKGQGVSGRQGGPESLQGFAPQPCLLVLSFTAKFGQFCLWQAWQVQLTLPVALRTWRRAPRKGVPALEGSPARVERKGDVSPRRCSEPAEGWRDLESPRGPLLWLWSQGWT